MALISLFFVFVSCSKSESNEDSGKRLHSYDIKFVIESGSNTIRYTYGGTDTNSNQVRQFKENVGAHGALTVDFTKNTDLIKGVFLLNANGNPLDLDYEGYQSLDGSLLEFRDSAMNRVFKGVSGTVTITNKVITESSNPVRAASYIMSFSGEFDLTHTDTGETIRISGSGTVKVGQPI